MGGCKGEDRREGGRAETYERGRGGDRREEVEEEMDGRKLERR
jgi:hypothetical protein